MTNEADFETSLEKKVEDPEFRAEYDALEPEYEFLKLLPETDTMYTARQFSKITGLSRAKLRRLKNDRDPSLKVMERLASATGYRAVCVSSDFSDVLKNPHVSENPGFPGAFSVAVVTSCTRTRCSGLCPPSSPCSSRAHIP